MEASQKTMSDSIQDTKAVLGVRIENTTRRVRALACACA